MSKKLPYLKKVVVGAAAALTMGGALLTSSAPAEASPWRGYSGYRHVGYYGYRPYHYRRGPAVAAGLIGGLALGAIAAQHAYATPVYYGGRCWIERRVRVNRWGERVVRNVKLCR